MQRSELNGTFAMDDSVAHTPSDPHQKSNADTNTNRGSHCTMVPQTPMKQPTLSSKDDVPTTEQQCDNQLMQSQHTLPSASEPCSGDTHPWDLTISPEEFDRPLLFLLFKKETLRL